MRSSRFLNAAQQAFRSARHRFSQARTSGLGKRVATVAAGAGLSMLAGSAALAEAEARGGEEKAEIDPFTGRFVSPNGVTCNDAHPDRHPNWRWFLWDPTPFTGEELGWKYYNDDLPEDMTFLKTIAMDIPRVFDWWVRGLKDYFHKEEDMIAGHLPVLPPKNDGKKLTLVVERIATYVHTWDPEDQMFLPLPRLHFQEFNETVSKLKNMEKVLWMNLPRNMLLSPPFSKYNEPDGPEPLEAYDPYLIYDHYLADDDFTLFRFHTYRNLLRLDRDMRRIVFLTIDHEKIAQTSTKRWGLLTKRDRKNCMFISDSVWRFEDHSLRHALHFLQKLDYYSDLIDDVRPKIAAWNANPLGNHFEQEEAIAGVVTDPKIVTPLDAPDKYVDGYDPDTMTCDERMLHPYFKHPF